MPRPDVLGLEPLLRPALPTVDWQRLAGVKDLAHGTVYAEGLADRAVVTPSDVPALRKRVAADRQTLWFSARALAAAGLLPTAEVDAVRKGRGAADQATDVSVLCGLVRKHWTACEGKTALTLAFLDQADAAATALLAAVKPAEGEDRGKDAGLASLQAQRDRFWTLLVNEYSVARKVGYWHWGEDVDDHVPPLRARR